MYEIYVRGHLVKSYEHKEQVEAFCFMNGYVSSGFDEWGGHEQYFFMNPNVKVIQKEKESGV